MKEEGRVVVKKPLKGAEPLRGFNTPLPSPASPTLPSPVKGEEKWKRPLGERIKKFNLPPNAASALARFKPLLNGLQL